MNITEEDRQKLAKLARKMGNENAKTLLSVLGHDKEFVDAITSPLGEELLKDAVTCIESKLYLVLTEKDKPEDRAEIRAYTNIVNKWTRRINKYEQNKDRLMKALK